MQMSKLTIDHEREASRSETGLAGLAQDLKDGKEGALEAFIGKTERACYRLALSILKDPDLTRDALQESYFVVYRKIGQLNDLSAIKSWLFRIVTRSCHDILRKRKREVETDLEQREDLMAPGDSDGTPRDPSRAVDQKELIRSTFEDLREIDRQTLALREVCSLSYEEMSRVLSVPIGTVRSRLAKARKRFIQAYRKEQNS
jgi:RNA polymerase sigma-70 factor (ECF subfamily)